ncbi:unnamed protein product [Closterium sp. NIES-54]
MTCPNCPYCLGRTAFLTLPCLRCPTRSALPVALPTCCLAHDRHAALLALCPTLHCACTLPCPAARAPPCPVARALPCSRSLAARTLPCPTTTATTATATVVAASGGGQQQQLLPETLSPQQLREWVIRRGRPGGGGYGAGGRPGGGGYGAGGTGQQRQQCQQETLSPQQLHEWDSRQRVPGSAEATSLARASTVLPCLAAPSGSLTGFHLPWFSKNLVSNAVLQVQFVIVNSPRGELVAICQVAVSGQFAASCSCRLLSHQTLLWHHRLCHPSLPRLCGMNSCLLVSRLPRSLPPLPRSLAPSCLPCVEGRQCVAPHSSFPPTIAPLQTLHMDLNLWPHVSVPKTSPTLRSMGEVGDASAFRVWGTLSLVCDTTAGKLSPRTLRCVFLGFPTDAPPWQFYHPASRRVLSSLDITFDESGPSPSGVSQVDPSPLVEPFEVSFDTSGPTEGGDPAADDTAATRHSQRLETPPGFPPRPSSPPP